MKIKPLDYLNRAITLKQQDKELYMFIVNIALLSGIFLGTYLSFLIVILCNL